MNTIRMVHSRRSPVQISLPHGPYLTGPVQQLDYRGFGVCSLGGVGQLSNKTL